MQASKASQQYLSKYAEKEVTCLQEALGQNSLSSSKACWQHCLCIPVYDEGTTFIESINQFLAQQTNSLIILVVNQPDQVLNDNDNNLQTVKQIKNSYHACWQQQHINLYSCNETKNNHLLLIDRYSTGFRIPHKEGVGLARKIAMDCALYLYTSGQLNTPWVNSSDADVFFPTALFEPLQQLKTKPKARTHAAAIYPFSHVKNRAHKADKKLASAVEKATSIYEASLRHYVDGLTKAQSPYAFYTIGSILAINLEHYASVRGFPKRSAAEDFYLLNKLRKTGEIINLDTPIIQIACRESSRVPFGTGPAVSKLLAHAKPEDAKIFYHPEIFNLLGTVLAWLEGLFTEINNEPSIIWPDHLQRFLKKQQNNEAPTPLISEALRCLDFDKGLQHCLSQASNPQQFKQHMLCWFDAFKTLKFLHYLKDHGFANIDYRQLTSPFKKIG